MREVPLETLNATPPRRLKALERERAMLEELKKLEAGEC